MQLTLNKYINRRLLRALAEFDLINDNDKIMVGLSGGKDSAFILYALKVLQKHLSINFSLSAVTVKPIFTKLTKSDRDNIKNFCNDLGIDHFFTEIKSIKNKLENKENNLSKNPCAYCSHFRRGAIIEIMNKKKFNKLCFGHHRKDVLETFLLSLFYSGQLITFPPRRFLPENNKYIIRPMIYIDEYQIRNKMKKLPYLPLENTCPHDGKTKRDKIKIILDKFDDKKQIYNNLFAAIRQSNEDIELWPDKKNDKLIQKRVAELWSG
ncbi:MAG: tRNA 2-thiocytidine biosynthesis TtcA family protein [Halanaerobiales bacterium]